jgi:hypothetical protein
LIFDGGGGGGVAFLKEIGYLFHQFGMLDIFFQICVPRAPMKNQIVRPYENRNPDVYSIGTYILPRASCIAMWTGFVSFPTVLLKVFLK